MSPAILSPTIFLDTNAIHNTISYLIQARRLNLPPFGPMTSYQEVLVGLKQIFPEGMAVNLCHGLLILSHLQDQVEQHDAVVFTSRLAICELWYGRLEGQAHIRMSLEGIPYRQKQQQSLLGALVMSRLTQEDYSLVSNELNDLILNLEKSFGISINFVEDNGASTPAEISKLALEINRLTFLDVIDCMFFAGSLAVLASELLTADGHLCNVVNNLKNPNNVVIEDGRDLWRSAQQSLINYLRLLHLNEDISADYICQPRKPKSLSTAIANLHILDNQ